MAKVGGGGGGGCHPQQVFQFFSEMERAFFRTKFLLVGSSLGHLPMKNFQIGPIILALKLDKGRVLEGWQPPQH